MRGVIQNGLVFLVLGKNETFGCFPPSPVVSRSFVVLSSMMWWGVFWHFSHNGCVTENVGQKGQKGRVHLACPLPEPGC